jgi:hypothetical protein
MLCKVCKKQIPFWQLAIDHTCPQCYNQQKYNYHQMVVSNEQPQGKAADNTTVIQKELKIYEPHQSFSFAALFLKVFGFTSAIVIALIECFYSSTVFAFLHIFSTTPVTNAGILLFLSTLLLLCVSMVPSMVLFGIGKIVDAAHLYVEKNS